MSSDATDNTMRAEFEARIPSFWSRARAVDSDGDSLYVDDWVQGAWIGYQAGRADTARQVAEWQPIDTAPKDGTVIDLWSEEFGRFADHYWGLPNHDCGEMGSLCDSDWHSLQVGWTDGFFDPAAVDDFTHWMPLPTPPTDASRHSKPDREPSEG